MSRLRDAAALFVIAGKALGHAEHARTLATTLAAAPTTVFAELIATEQAAALEYEQLGKKLTGQAQALMAELEHPGAVLARRLVAVAHAARAAWRGAR